MLVEIIWHHVMSCSCCLKSWRVMCCQTKIRKDSTISTPSLGWHGSCYVKVCCLLLNPSGSMLLKRVPIFKGHDSCQLQLDQHVSYQVWHDLYRSSRQIKTNHVRFFEMKLQILFSRLKISKISLEPFFIIHHKPQSLDKHEMTPNVRKWKYTKSYPQNK